MRARASACVLHVPGVYLCACVFARRGMRAGLVHAGSRVCEEKCHVQTLGMTSGGAPVVLTGLRPAPGAAVPGVAANHTGTSIDRRVGREQSSCVWGAALCWFGATIGPNVPKPPGWAAGNVSGALEGAGGRERVVLGWRLGAANPTAGGRLGSPRPGRPLSSPRVALRVFAVWTCLPGLGSPFCDIRFFTPLWVGSKPARGGRAQLAAMHVRGRFGFLGILPRTSGSVRPAAA